MAACLRLPNGFWSLCGSYSTGASDGATVITTVHISDQEKRVSDYFNSAPQDGTTGRRYSVQFAT